MKQKANDRDALMRVGEVYGVWTPPKAEQLEPLITKNNKFLLFSFICSV